MAFLKNFLRKTSSDVFKNSRKNSFKTFQVVCERSCLADRKFELIFNFRNYVKQ